MKKYIESKYYSCEEVHNLNSFLKGLEEGNCSKNLMDKVILLLSYYRSLDKSADYVEGSAKQLEILAENKQYEDALAELKGLNYRRERLLEECYPSYINLFKITITVKDTYFDYESEEDVVDVFFYQETWSKKFTLNPEILCLPYTRESGIEEVDLIQELINKHNYITQKLHCQRICTQSEIDFEVFCKVFDFQKVAFFGGLENWYTLKYEDVGYSIYDVKKLLEEYKVASEKKYIKEDRIVDYPRNKLFIDFKQSPLLEY